MVGELFNVFEFGILKYLLVMEVFIVVLKRKMYDEMYDMFLLNWIDDFEFERIKCFFEFFVLIDVDGFFKDVKVGEDYRIVFVLSIRLISWVIYYGYYIILEYIINYIL